MQKFGLPYSHFSESVQFMGFLPATPSLPATVLGETGVRLLLVA
jgi:hypothetical protein